MPETQAETIHVETVPNLTPTRLFGPHNTFLTALAYSPNGKFAASGDLGGVVKLWDIEKGHLINELRITAGEVRVICFGESTDEGEVLLVGGRNGDIKVLLLTPDKSIVTQYNSTSDDLTILAAAFNAQKRPVVACISKNEDDRRVYLMYGDDKKFITAFRIANSNNPNVCFSPDGAYIAVGGEDGRITVRSVQASSVVVKTIDSQLSGVKMTTFSPDGTRLAAMEDVGDRMRVFDVQGAYSVGTAFSILFADKMAFNHDGTVLAVTSQQKGGTLSLRNVETGDKIRSIKGSSPLMFSPLGNGLLCGNSYAPHSKSITLWDNLQSPDGLLEKVISPLDAIAARAYNVRQLATLEAHTKPILAIAFSPDGMLLATAGEDSKIALWNMETGGESAEMHDHKADITGLSFNPDSKLLVSSSGYFRGNDDNSVRMWDVSETSQILQFTQHAVRVVDVEFHPRGEWVVSADAAGVVHVWQVADGRKVQTIETPSPINQFALSPNGALIATTHGCETHMKDTLVRLWNTATGEHLRDITDMADWVLDVAFTPDGNRLIATDYGGRVCGWDVANGQLVMDVNGGQQVVINPQGDLMALAQDKSVKLVSADNGETLMPLRHGADITRMAFNHQGEMLAIGNKRGEVVVWGVSTTSSALANTGELERQRIESARSGRHTFQMVSITCAQVQERDGDETFIRVDGQTVWSVEQVGRKMHHKPNRAKDIRVYDFLACRMENKDGWQPSDDYEPTDFRMEGLTGPIDVEIWEADMFLRGGNDFIGRVTVSPSQAGQGVIEKVIYGQGATYIFAYEVLPE